MDKKIEIVIGELKEQIKSNLKRINTNQDSINEILMITSHEERERRAGEFEDLFEENKHLLSENDDLIKLQIELLRFNKKYNGKDFEDSFKRTESMDDTKIEYTSNEVFEMTVKDKIPFNSYHPYFNDEKFFNKLINFYANQERYETCDALVKLKR